jgi:polyhydroxybutyrate depolymerase
MTFLLMGLALAVGAAACTSDNADPVTVPQPNTLGPTTAPSTITTTTTVPIRRGIDESIVIEFGGGERRYHLFVPGGFPDVASPLVVDLHGALGTPDMQDALSGMRAKAVEEGFVVVQPAGLLRSWDIITGGDGDVAFVMAVIADAQARTAVDADRIYATGMSNGGGMAERLACSAGDTFAAFAPVAGWHVPAVECNGDQVPLLAFHGTADLVVPYDGTGPLFVPVEEWVAEWAVRNGCDPTPVEERLTDDVTTLIWAGCSADTQLVTIEGGGHGWPGSEVSILALSSTDTIDATDMIWDFFVAHPRSGP